MTRRVLATAGGGTGARRITAGTDLCGSPGATQVNNSYQPDPAGNWWPIRNWIDDNPADGKINVHSFEDQTIQEHVLLRAHDYTSGGEANFGHCDSSH